VSAVLAIDAGTTGVRAMAVDETGVVIGRSYREFDQHFPRPGWVEHDADEIWAVTQEVLAEVVGQLDVAIAAIGITDQRETVVAWSRATGRPLHRAIVWQDRRTTARCEQLVSDGHLPRIRELTGLVADPYFSGSKMEWLLTEGGVSRDDADLALGTIDSWLLWNLTDGAVFATDPSNASRTMLFDIVSGGWSEELCELFGIPMGALAEVGPSCGRFGTTAPTCVAGAGIPVSGIAGDQQSALFGQCCTRPGMAKNTYGTGSFVLMNVGEDCPPPTEGLLTTVAWEVPSRVMRGRADGTVTHYALEGAIFVTGALVQWLRDGLGIIDAAADTGPLAESVPDAGGVVVVPAFTGLGAPWWDPNARGTILGLSRGSTRAHLARAAVESMVFQTRDVVDAMTIASGQTIEELRVDGGASVMPLLLRLQADQLGVRVARPSVTETTALGAAHLAGLAEGVWSDVDEVAAAWQRDVEIEPGGDRGVLDAAHAQWRRGVDRSRAWVSA
jgi:glycerol kinase